MNTDTNIEQQHAKDIATAQGYLDRELAKDEPNSNTLLSLANNWADAAERSKNKELHRLSKIAQMEGNTAYFDQRYPAAHNDSEIELLCRNVAVRGSALRGTKSIQRIVQQFSNRGFAEGMLFQVNKSCGGPVFEELCELGLGDMSAEFTVWTHMRERLNAKVATLLEDLLLEKGLIKNG